MTQHVEITLKKGKFGKTCLSKYVCHGNTKVDGQGTLMSKCFQINVRKGHQILWL